MLPDRMTAIWAAYDVYLGEWNGLPIRSSARGLPSRAVNWQFQER
jgi:hypothetical protein